MFGTACVAESRNTIKALIEITEYDKKYALETVKMWRASMEKALGIKDSHTWEEQLGSVDV